MSLFTFNDNFKINAPKHIDTRYLNPFAVPYANTADVNATIPMGYRYLGLTVLIGSLEYWYQAGITDPDLVPKIGGGGGGIISADNGLIVAGGTTVELGDVSAPGSPLIRDSYIDAGTNFKLQLNGNSNANNIFEVNQSGAGFGAIYGSNLSAVGGFAIWGNALDGATGVQGTTTTGVGVYGNATAVGFASYFSTTTLGATTTYISATGGSTPLYVYSDQISPVFQLSAATNNDVQALLRIQRLFAGPGANGIGGSIEYYNTDDTGGTVLSNRIISELSNVVSGFTDSNLRITGYNTGTEVDKLTISPVATSVIATRFEEAMGATITAANDLVIGTDGNLFNVSGSTQINAITVADWQAGAEIGLIFIDTPTLKNNTAGGGGTAPMLLAGGVDYTAAINDYFGFRYDGTVWHETNRKIAASGGLYTFSNGLTESPSTQVELGGTISKFTDLTVTGDKYLRVNSLTNTTQAPFVVANSGGADGIQASSTSGSAVSANGFIGVFSVSNGNSAFYGTMSGGGPCIKAISSSNNYNIYAETTVASTNTVRSIMQLDRISSGTPAAGIGTSIDYALGVSGAGVGNRQISNTLVSKWTTAADATRTSEFSITGVNSAATSTLMTLSGNGAVRFNKYGVGTFPGTPVYNVLVDASGNFIEGSVPVGSNTTASNGLTKVVNDVRLGGTLTANTTITNGAFLLTMAGNVDPVNGATLVLTNSFAAGRAILATSGTGGVAVLAQTGSGTGLYGSATTGIGLTAVSTSNYAITATTNSGSAVFQGNTVTIGSGINTVTNALEIGHLASVSGANGIGCAIRYSLGTTLIGQLSNELISKWNDATSATRTSEFYITGVSNAVTSTIASFRVDQAQFFGTGTAISTTTGSTGASITGSSIGIIAISGTQPFQANNTSTSTNTVVNGITIGKSLGSYNGAAGVGVDIQFKLNNSAGAATITGQIFNKLTTATAGVEISQFVTKGLNGSGGIVTFSDIDSQSARFYGVGSAIYTDTGITGVFGQGSTTGVLAQSSVIPLWANNITTVNNTVVDGLLIQRAGSYTGVNGVGVQIRFDQRNGLPTTRTTGKIISKLNDVTDTAEDAGFEFHGMNAGALGAILTITGAGLFTLTHGLQNYANDGAAAAGGIPINGLYRNGSVVQIRVT